MTLCEVVKSNIPFKRPNWQFWVSIHFGSNGGLYFKTTSGQLVFCTYEDLIADDYILMN